MILWGHRHGRAGIQFGLAHAVEVISSGTNAVRPNLRVVDTAQFGKLSVLPERCNGFALRQNHIPRRPSFFSRLRCNWPALCPFFIFWAKRPAQEMDFGVCADMSAAFTAGDIIAPQSNAKLCYGSVFHFFSIALNSGFAFLEIVLRCWKMRPGGTAQQSNQPTRLKLASTAV